MATSKDFRVKNGLVVEQDISFGGSFKDLSGNPISLGGTSSDTYTVKDALVLQQSETPLGTVVSKTSIPSIISPVTYTGGTPVGQAGGTPSEILTTLNINYCQFYSTYGYIYMYSGATNDALKELFAVGKTVTIQKDGFFWVLAINTFDNYGSSAQIGYTVTSTNSPWGASPGDYDSYYGQDQPTISFSGTLVTPEQYVLTLSGSTAPLTADAKLLFNGSQTDTPYLLSVTNVGTWDIGITAPEQYKVDFGSNSVYSNQNNLRKLLSVGTTITLSDNTWGGSGVYLVTAVGQDQSWFSPNGFRVTFQYVSGTDYPNTYSNLAGIFSNYFSSASGTITPNYTVDHIEDFAISVGSTYKSFNQYDYLSIGDAISYIPATTSIQFKDNAGNNIKAITYNNNTSELTYDGIVQALEYNSTTKSHWTNTADPVRKVMNINSNNNSVLAIGNNAKSFENAIAIGRNAHNGNSQGIAIGYDSYSGSSSVSIGVSATSGSDAVAIGSGGASGNGYASVAIGTQSNASGNYSIAIGYNAYANNFSQFSYGSNGTGFRNQTSVVQWGNYNTSHSTNNYITLGTSTYTSTTPGANSGLWFYLQGLAGSNGNTMAIAEATVMYKPIQDQNNNDIKVQVIKFLVRTITLGTWVIDQLSTTDIFTGTGTLNSNWTTSFEIYGGDKLVCRVNKGGDTTAIGVTAKVEFKVLSTQ